jgi:heme-degrading monooxygenase HmoA
MKEIQPHFIDSFLIPANSIEEFKERTRLNRNLIRQLSGFVEDHAYEHFETNGDLRLITIAVWVSEDALAKAKDIVQAEYQKEGFNPAAMMKRLNIRMERGIYFPVLN